MWLVSAGDTYRPRAIVVRVRGEPVAPRQRERGGGRQGGVVAAAAAAFDVAVATVAVVGQHPVAELLLDVAEAAPLHLDVARAVREGERGGAQLEGSRATAARFRRRNGGRRVHIATYRGLENHVKKNPKKSER